MGFLRALFGPSKEEVWRQLCERIGARFIDGGWLWGGEKVQSEVGEWIITLDTYTVSTGKSNVTFTRIRAPFVNKDRFRFTIYKRGFFSDIGKLFGMQDIEIGMPEFDRQFIIKLEQLSDENMQRLQALFSDSRIRDLFQAQPNIHLQVNDHEGWFGANFPDGVDELRFHVVGVIKDVNRLQSLFSLFSETLEQLCHMDSAYVEDPERSRRSKTLSEAEGERDVDRLIASLIGPGGQVKDHDVVLWEGDVQRRAAAEELGRLREPKAVESLMLALSDNDPILREKAGWALGEIGDVRAVAGLVPLIGDIDREGGLAFATDALKKLGEISLVNAFFRSVSGDRSSVMELKTRTDLRNEIIAALIKALDAKNESALNAANALAELGAVEALPRLKEKRTIFTDSQFRENWKLVIDKLEARAALPRAAKESSRAESLPRISEGDAGALSKETMPRAAQDSPN